MSETPTKPLDLESLERLTVRLQESISAYNGEPENLFYLDSVVKRFELTFEIARKLLRRYLIDTDPTTAKIPPEQLQEFIRLGTEQKLLRGSWPEWKRIRDARNETVHGYREEKAREIASMAEPMLAEALVLLENLKRRTHRNGGRSQS
jgi:nucleotidyltransferase substrate binding protein (TIGR01987 family)